MAQGTCEDGFDLADGGWVVPEGPFGHRQAQDTWEKVWPETHPWEFSMPGFHPLCLTACEAASVPPPSPLYSYYVIMHSCTIETWIIIQLLSNSARCELQSFARPIVPSASQLLQDHVQPRC